MPHSKSAVFNQSQLALLAALTAPGLGHLASDNDASLASVAASVPTAATGLFGGGLGAVLSGVTADHLINGVKGDDFGVIKTRPGLASKFNPKSRAGKKLLSALKNYGPKGAFVGGLAGGAALGGALPAKLITDWVGNEPAPEDDGLWSKIKGGLGAE